MKNFLTIGLFGTCGSSIWRSRFIEKYNELGIDIYNPQVPKGTWKPEFAGIEAKHLASDEIILFPVLNDTYGIGSLSEVGFSILNAIKLDINRNFIILIDDKVEDSLLVNVDKANESNTLRALVKQHLKRLKLSNVYLVNTLEEMLYVSIVLHQAETLKLSISKYSVSEISNIEE